MFWGQKFKRTDNCSFVHKLHGDGQTEASHNWEVWAAKCFKGVQHLPCEYRHNTKAWMTSVVFEEWLLCLEHRMKAQKRILLIIDNCSSHNCVPRHLEHVKVLFLPPSTTSILQPMDRDNSHTEAALPSSCGPVYAV